MRTHRFELVILSACFGLLAAAVEAGEEPTKGPGADVLEGKWLIFEGREVKDEGYYFDVTMATACGNAQFRDYPQRRVNFEPTRPPGSKSIPWGLYGYKFDPNGILTLMRPDGPDIRCFLKFKSERLRSLAQEPPTLRPYICVFYDPEGRRAFKLFRMGEEIGSLATAPELAMGGTVFVPYEDRLTGSWLLLASQPKGTAAPLEFRLDVPAVAMRMAVHADNSAELRAGERAARFRLRQTDPSHWAIVPLADIPCATGTIALERDAGRIIGPNVLVTRWRIGPRTLTAVFQAEGSRLTPDVPMIRFDGADFLDLEALLAATPPRPATGFPGPPPK